MSFREDGHAAVEWVASYLERLRDLPVKAQVEPGSVRRSLPPAPPEQAEPFADVLRDLEHVLLPAHTNWQSPRFFAYFPNTGSDPGVLAEMLAAALNPVAFHWEAAPAATELEQVAMSWLLQLLGLPEDWHGHIEDTASTSTFAAIVAARHARPDRRVVVCSEQAHSSVEKAARMAGLETRAVPVDDSYRMRADALDLADAVAAVATVGTTSSAAVDPVPAVADACARDGAWLHVDAAYAGSSWVCPELRGSQEGVERADSLVVNPHKWLLVPMDCSCLFTRRPEALREAFTLVPAYLRTQTEDVVNLSEYGPALGRRFRALKLWAVLRCHGRDGLRETIRRHVELAARFEEWVAGDGRFELAAPRSLSLVCFRLRGGDDANERLLRNVNASGEVYLSHTELAGRYVLRLAIGNARTTEEDVALAWQVIRREAEAL